MRLARGSGILLHPTSLPGRFGIGDLGPAADAFLDLLAATGQRWWQMLPIGPVGAGNSPYQSLSSYAGNSLLISPERLLADGLMSKADLRGYPKLPSEHVDFGAVISAKEALLRRAYARFRGSEAFESYRSVEAPWLDDYTLFMALKKAHGQREWTAWHPDLVGRIPAALAEARKELADEIRFHQFVQFAFDLQWNRLRVRAEQRGIGLIGDVPIFVALDSVDVWANPDLFLLDARGRPTHVAGVPPDYFNRKGQHWGNPLYRWDAHEAQGFAWWIDRMKATLRRVDIVRLDHFRGFEAYYEIPADARDAADPRARWVSGPGSKFLEAIRTGLGGLPLIAEDLGAITPAVHALRDEFQLPGMRVLQFGFGADDSCAHDLPHTYTPHCVVYTGTHDNDTTVGWFTGSPAGKTTQSARAVADERAFALRYLGSDGREIQWDLIRAAFGSVADTALVPMQDILGLGTEARMNRPGIGEGNWAWRYLPEQLTPDLRTRLATLTAAYDRWNGPHTGLFLGRKSKPTRTPTTAKPPTATNGASLSKTPTKATAKARAAAKKPATRRKSS